MVLKSLSRLFIINNVHNLSKSILGKRLLKVNNVASQRHYSSGKFSIYVTRPINQEAMDILKQHCNVTGWQGSGPVPREELLKNCVGKDGLYVLLTEKIDKEVLDRAGPQLKMVSTMSVGFDHIDLQEIKRRNIKTGYTPKILTDATAELNVGLLLAVSRRMFEANEEARTGGWKTWAPFWMCGPGLENSTVGIIGFGRIGQELAKRLKPFKPKRIIYSNLSDVSSAAREIGATSVSLDELLKESDFVSLNVTSNPKSKNMFTTELFNKMKPESIIVNTARGDTIVTDDLVKALQEKKIGGAGLDVMNPEPLPLDHPLFKMKNVVILPHIASATFDTRKNMGTLAARNLIAGLKGQKIPEEIPIP